MKILFNTYSMAFQRPGGGEQILDKTYKELRARGIEVELFDPWNTKIEKFDIVHHFSLLEWEKFKDYRDFGAKVVVTPTAWPSVDFKTITKEKLKTALFQTINPNRSALTLSSYQDFVDLFLPTTSIEQGLIEQRYGIPSHKCRVLPNGVDAPQRIALEDNEFYKKYQIDCPIVYSGSIRSNKNIELLIQTCIKNQWPLIIMGAASAGSESYERKCRELSANTSTPILWTGYIEQGSQTYNEIYSLAKCVCIPSDFETFCLAAAQASALGKPVVVPFKGGTTEIYGPHAAYLREYTVDALTNAIETALQIDSKELQSLEELMLTKYSWNHIIDQLISCYREL